MNNTPLNKVTGIKLKLVRDQNGTILKPHDLSQRGFLSLKGPERAEVLVALLLSGVALGVAHIELGVTKNVVAGLWFRSRHGNAGFQSSIRLDELPIMRRVIPKETDMPTVDLTSAVRVPVKPRAHRATKSIDEPRSVEQSVNKESTSPKEEVSSPVPQELAGIKDNNALTLSAETGSDTEIDTLLLTPPNIRDILGRANTAARQAASIDRKRNTETTMFWASLSADDTKVVLGKVQAVFDAMTREKNPILTASAGDITCDFEVSRHANVCSYMNDDLERCGLPTHGNHIVYCTGHAALCYVPQIPVARLGAKK